MNRSKKTLICLSLIARILFLCTCKMNTENGIFQNAADSAPVSKVRWIEFLPLLNTSTESSKRFVAVSHLGVHFVDKDHSTGNAADINYVVPSVANDDSGDYHQARIVIVPSNFSYSAGDSYSLILGSADNVTFDSGSFWQAPITNIPSQVGTHISVGTDHLTRLNLSAAIKRVISVDQRVHYFDNSKTQIPATRCLIEKSDGKFVICNLIINASDKTIDSGSLEIEIDFSKQPGGNPEEKTFTYANADKWSTRASDVYPARFWTSPNADSIVFMDSVGLYYYGYKSGSTYKCREILTKSDLESNTAQKKREWLDAKSNEFRMHQFIVFDCTSPLKPYSSGEPDESVRWIAVSKNGSLFHNLMGEKSAENKGVTSWNYRTKDSSFSFDYMAPIGVLGEFDKQFSGQVVADEKNCVTLFARYSGSGYIFVRIHKTPNGDSLLIRPYTKADGGQTKKSDESLIVSTGFADSLRSSTITDITTLRYTDDDWRIVVGTIKGGVTTYRFDPNAGENNDGFTPGVLQQSISTNRYCIDVF